MSDRPASEWHQPQRFYEALGRTMAALDVSRALEGATELRWWSADHTWKIEWREGPYPYEVAARLWQDASAAESTVALAVGGLIRLDPPTGSPNYTLMRVMNVPVLLRALEPTGADEIARRMRQQLVELVSAMQDRSPRPGPSPHQAKAAADPVSG
ncbi:hypothetical protein GA0070622_6434 [Micromonospora sediminicola]|uniref:Uncharacterized protein n=1 Tax=Micromonospora sediminicola TaxID=946078 RepID=A0A1A9BK28_9ACTN|nr:hypothetical protein [Micromonospora sediminicola]SBT69309.1 hypothetical protein GA0070622_6434 [Micromonospora sediminicola]